MAEIMTAILLDTLPTREGPLMERMEDQMTPAMIRDEITHHLSITIVEIILPMLRQDITKIIVEDTILGTWSLLPGYVLQLIRGDHTIEEQYLEKEQTFLITIDSFLDRVMTFVEIHVVREKGFRGFHPITGRRGISEVILDIWTKV